MIVMTEGKPGEGMTCPDSTTNHFPARFRQIRKDMKLKQTAMAERLGVGLSTLQRYEKGTACPTSDVLERVAALGVDLHYLITGSPSKWPCSEVRSGVVFFAFRSEQFKDIESLLQQKDIPVSALHQMIENYILGIVYSLKYLNEKPL